MRRGFATLFGLVIATSCHAVESKPDAGTSICLMMDSAAQANGLPVEFLTRVIWRESRFDPGAIGPRTRSGARAEGIAQFMPGTAAERNLDDPFDPVQALPHAAAFLRELRDAFGNLGLAAAAYNAGPQRVRDWLGGARTLPGETQRYVRAVTGHDAEEWIDAGDGKIPGPSKTCEQAVASLGQRGDFAIALQERVTSELAKPWGVELAAGFSRQRVLAFYGQEMKRVSHVIGEHDPVLMAGVLRTRGTSLFYRAQIGAETRTAANGLCARIRTAGAACLVIRNVPGRARVEQSEERPQATN